MIGIMDGTILVRAIPQFMKQCCFFAQFQYVHNQMVYKAGGELYK